MTTPPAPLRAATEAEKLDALMWGANVAETLLSIGKAIGFGRAQQILGEQWDAIHNCAPRGSMGVTVRDESAPAPVAHRPAEGWISVEERLPEFDTGYVLMAASSGLVTTTLYCAGGAHYFKKYNAGNKASESFEHAAKYGYTVTHWMPLPEAPKGARNEQR